MHNNAIGPEICGKPKVEVIKDPPDCWQYDPSVEGRYRLYKASMDQLLNPGKRAPKVLTLDEDMVIDVAPKAELLRHTLGLTLRLPKGFPIVAVNSLRYKDLFQDLFLVARSRDEFDKKYQGILTDRQREELSLGLLAIRERLIGQKGITIIQLALGKEDAVAETVQASVLNVGDRFIQKFYSNVLSWDENAGHAFGAGLSEREKQALIAFVATL
jgi:hypothetical protein